MPSKPNILILGPSGSGKTSSLEPLFEKHAANIAFIDLERKGLPFLFDLGRLAFYAECASLQEAQQAMTKAKGSSASILVYDSFASYLDMLYQQCKTVHSGYEIWNAYSEGIRALFEFNKSTGKLWLMTALDEVVYIEQAEGSRLSRIRAAVQGKKWEGKVEKEFLCVLFCTISKDKNGTCKHVFRTATDGITSAKAPKWLALPPEMPNDASVVVDKLIEAKLL